MAAGAGEGARPRARPASGQPPSAPPAPRCPPRPPAGPRGAAPRPLTCPRRRGPGCGGGGGGCARALPAARGATPASSVSSRARRRHPRHVPGAGPARRWGRSSAPARGRREAGPGSAAGGRAGAGLGRERACGRGEPPCCPAGLRSQNHTITAASRSECDVKSLG